MKSFRRADSACGKDEVGRICAVNRAGQSLRSAETGNDTETDFGLPELCLFGGNANIRTERKLAAAAECIAVDCRNDGNSKVFKCAKRFVTVRTR